MHYPASFENGPSLDSQSGNFSGLNTTSSESFTHVQVWYVSYKVVANLALGDHAKKNHCHGTDVVELW